MATIIETVVTEEQVEYTIPVYRLIGDVHFKIYAANKMLIVDETAGYEKIRISAYPSSEIRAIADSTESDSATFEAARTAVLAIHAAL